MTAKSVRFGHLSEPVSCATIGRMEGDAGPVVYREEVMAIIGALADLVVEVRRIRETIEEDDGEAEAE